MALIGELDLPGIFGIMNLFLQPSLLVGGGMREPMILVYEEQKEWSDL